jgi:hypothetical protein
LRKVVRWTEAQRLQWAFTLSNAGARDFEDRCLLDQLNEIDWNAVQAVDWRDSDVKHGKQAEFLVEREVPWRLVEHIGVYSNKTGPQALAAMGKAAHRPPVTIESDWYY